MFTNKSPVFKIQGEAPKELQQKGNKIYLALVDKDTVKILKTAAVGLRNKRSSHFFDSNDHVDQLDKDDAEKVVSEISTAYDAVS